MALRGSFQNYPTGQFGLYCDWSGSQNQAGNYTDITLSVYLRIVDIYVGQRNDSIININGVNEIYTVPAITDGGSGWHNILLKTKTVRVVHDANGTKTGVNLSASWRFDGRYSNTNVGTITASATIDLDTITTYTLSTSAGLGSNITVNRTASGYAATGILSNGARLYKNDILKISFSPSANYSILSHTVNGNTFSSGNTHAVSENVSIVATAQELASTVAATDANIGGVSVLVVTKYNSTYYHSLSYSFGDLTGYITSSGDIQATESRFRNTSIAFPIPISFFDETPNSKTGTCIITCRTYSSAGSTSILGNETTCSIIVTATGAPTISGTVVDSNETTVALTGDPYRLIRYKSTAVATINAVANNSATILSKYINGATPSGDTRTFTSVEETSFNFRATDSRGYLSEITLHAAVIAYVNLSINPVISRPTPTSSQMNMTFTGDVYRGSFGAATNLLKIKYRYKASDELSYGDWINIPQTDIIYGMSSFSSNGALILEDDFDYDKDYLFQVEASDGTSSVLLSSVLKNVRVPRGTPTFDWGEGDFNFNVPVIFNAPIKMNLSEVEGDFNNYMDCGIYFFGSYYGNSVLNAPGNMGVLEVIAPSDEYIIQRFTEFSSGCAVYIRSLLRRGDTEWTMWTESAKLAECEQTSNKVTGLTPSSTNTQYPSAKCVYDTVESLAKSVAAEAFRATRERVGQSSVMPTTQGVMELVYMSCPNFIYTGETSGSAINGHLYEAVLTDGEYSVVDLTPGLSAGGGGSVDISGCEQKSNKVTALTSESTNTQYPSAKAVYDELANKVTAETGKGLSTNDFTTAEKTKLAGIPEGGGSVDISGCEQTSNKVTELVNTEVTDTQYPSAKCVFDTLVMVQDNIYQRIEEVNLSVASRLTCMSVSLAPGALTYGLCQLFLYTGETNSTYRNGHIYEIVQSGTEGNYTYSVEDRTSELYNRINTIESQLTGLAAALEGLL